MEGVPRLPMLGFELKSSTDSVEFTPALKSYIAEVYNENSNTYAKECAELDQLRQSAVQVSLDFVGCSLLKKYFSQLQYLTSRFPMSEGDAIQIPFTWADAFNHVNVSVTDVRFEQACILFNIGSLHSILGGMDTRSSPEGMKVSCTHFQCAAWAYQHLRDSFTSHWSPDFNFDLLTFMHNVMLAQAQECILEKSMTDNRKSSITAKVSAQIVLYYKLAIKHLDSCTPNNTVGTKRYKEWKQRIEPKILFYDCITLYYLGLQSEEQQKWGECVTYFQSSSEKLSECLKKSKSDASMDETLKFAHDVVVGKYNSAKKDNDFVYHDKIPALDTLPEVKGASLVKGIPFNPSDLEVSGPDIFKKLVPLEAHETSSLYSEELAKLLRRVGSQIEEKNQELTQYMSSLQLDTSKIIPQPQKLPQILIERCAAISVKPEAITDLSKAMQSLSSNATDVESNLKEIMDLLANEERAEKEMQTMYGKRPSSNVIQEELHKECLKYGEGLNKASKSNEELHKVMTQHVANLRLLSGGLEDLQKSLPAFEVQRSPEEESVMGEMKRLMEKVDEMKDQRKKLENQLREEIRKDDVTHSIVTRKDDTNIEAFFREQLEKHDKTVQLIQQNLSAQANILRALTDANASYASIRKEISTIDTKREARIQEMIISYDVYEDLLAKTQKGVEFYKKLSSSVTRLLERVRSLCKVQQEERDKMIERLTPKAPAPARPSAPKPGSNIEAATAPPDQPIATTDKLPIDQTVTHPMLPEISAETSAGYNITAGLPMGLVPGQSVRPATMPPMGYPGVYPGGARFPMGFPEDLSLDDDLSDLAEQLANVPLPPEITAALRPTKPGAPKLKDFLPFMKPGSFGAKANKTNGLPSAPSSHMAVNPGYETVSTAGWSAAHGSLPSSHSASPVHIPRQALSHPASPLTVNQSSNAGGHTMPYAGNYSSGNIQPGSSMYGNVPAGTMNMYNMPPGVSADNSMRFPNSGGMNVSGGVPQGVRGLPVSGLGGVSSGGDEGVMSPTAPPGAPRTVSPRPPVSQGGQGPLYHPGGPVGPYGPGVSAAGQYNVGDSRGNQSSITQQNVTNVPANQFSGVNPSQYNSAISSTSVASGQNSSYQSNVASSGYDNSTAQMPYSQSQYSQYSANLRPAGLQSQQINEAVRPAWNQSMYTQTGQQQTSQQQQIYQPQVHTQQGGNQLMQQPAAVQAHQLPQQPGTMQLPQQSQAHQLPQQSQAHQLPQQSQAHQLPQQSQMHQLPQQSQAHQLPQQSQAHQLPQQSGVNQLPQQSGVNQLPQQSGVNQLPQQSGAFQLPQQSGAFQLPQQSQQSQQSQLPQQSHLPQQSQLPQHSQLPQQPGAVQVQQSNVSYPHHSYQQLQKPPNQQYMTTTAQSHMNPQMQQGQIQPTQQQPYTANQPISQSPQHQLATGRQPQQQPGAPQQMGPYQGNQQQPVIQQQGPKPSFQQPSLQQPGFQQRGVQQINQQPPVVQQSGIPTSGLQQQGLQHPSQQPQMPGYQQQGLRLQQPGWQQPSLQQPGQQQHMIPGQQQQMPGHQQQLPGQRQQMPDQQQIPGQQQQISGLQQQVQGLQQPGQHQQMPGQQQQIQGLQQPGQHQPASLQSGQAQQYNMQQSRMQQPYAMNQQPVVPNPVLQLQPGIQQRPGLQQQPGMQQQQPYSQQYNNQPYTNVSSANSAGSQYIQHPANIPVNSQTTSVYEVPSSLPSPLKPMQTEAQPFPVNLSGPAPVPSPSGPQTSANVSETRVTPPVSSPVSGGGARRASQISNGSSLDEILSASPEGIAVSGVTSTERSVLTPHVVTEEELKTQKEEEARKSMKRSSSKDPYVDPDLLGRFVAEVEKFQSRIEGLTKETLSKYTPIGKEWKELNDEQDKMTHSYSMAIARCYPLKNRYPDVMPFDNSRVKLVGASDDYINASHIEGLGVSCPRFITTQSPMSTTLSDFWQMVYDQGTEVIVMLCNENEPASKILTYWPQDKAKPVSYGAFTVTLQSMKVKEDWIERIVTLSHKKTPQQSRSLVHLQYLNWTPGGLRSSPATLLQFVSEAHNFYIQQRSLMKPLIVHCSNGIGRTGAFCAIYAGVQEINQGHGIIHVPDVVLQLRKQRKNMIEKQEQLQFCYEAILYYAQDLLMKRGILTTRASFGDKLPHPGGRSHSRKPSDDFILGQPNVTALHSTISKLHSQPCKKSLIQPDPVSDPLPAVPATPAPYIPGSSSDQPPLTQQVFTSDVAPDFSAQSENLIEADSSKSLSSGDLSEGTAAGKLRPSSATEVVLETSSSEASTSQSMNQPLGDKALSLADLQNPNTFRIDSVGPGKKKITKANFTSSVGKLMESKGDEADPLSQLDPLWSIKNN